ncbi:hypothetical protein [Winogradskyella sp.]|nr:hypothetical protein [Winogradskyella sp.]
MKKKHFLLLVLSPILLLGIFFFGPFYLIHVIVDGRYYNAKVQ